ncbi:beta-propeller domain-containing protein [Parasphingopyxis sp.]|uniref:beta-propeller domain-containing protein n=1 Tax=Parasphingopyxis sp. TaxID=1920299 RepID=UPI002627BB5A|nr:beta-propeller domain-containing protein [Parasphingopyxis sp.]
MPSRSSARAASLGKRLAIACLAIGLPLQAACVAEAGGSGVETAASDGLRAFESESELTAYLERLRESNRRARNEAYDMEGGVAEDAAAELAPVPTVAQADEESITNNQTADVDEGGIVKRRGDLLIVLRRGRLFTISTAGGEMRAIDHIDAFPPGASGGASWYDEMLVRGDRVIVIGYSYPRGGTEVNRFRLSEDGQLTFEDAHHLRSNDYYSADNYASRLIGDELIFYTPLNLYYGRTPLDALPGVKRWDGETGADSFERIAGPSDIYVARDLFEDPENGVSTLHSVTRCDVASDDFDCTATGVIAGWSREFYVSAGSVYLWVTDGGGYGGGDNQSAHIYRLPLDGSQPSAIGARGMPIDQFSFLEQPDEGRLNILVAGRFADPAIEITRGSGGVVSLLQVPLDDFGDGSQDVSEDRYRALSEAGNIYEMENRYVGNHIVYGWGRQQGYGARTRPVAFTASLGGGDPTQIDIGHGVERIERLGSDAVVIGSGAGNKLGFSAVALDGTPRIADVFTMPAAGQGESRSHAYFYRPDSGSEGGASGTLGLPISRQVEPRFRQLFGSSAAMLFLRRDDREFSLAGELGAEVEGVVDDNCQASCVDWYGNARPIFMGSRIFALMGYELVEGRMANGRIGEIGRLDYAPRVATASAE